MSAIDQLSLTSQNTNVGLEGKELSITLKDGMGKSETKGIKPRLLCSLGKMIE